jgi:hypothetical protein
MWGEGELLKIKAEGDKGNKGRNGARGVILT